ncbi:MAG: phosphonate C-P lyase system protein PhnH [Pseudomonadota bacterium]
MQAETLEGGFADPPREAAYAFRGLMRAMARPGTIETLAGAAPPAPLSPAAGTALLTLCDPDTPLYLAGAFDTPDIRAWVAFHTGAPLTGPAHCAFALGSWEDVLPLDPYPIGTPEYPDRSATLIIECEALAQSGATLSGPGIRDTATLALPDTELFRRNTARFPLGLDFLFTAGREIAAMPRTTRIV